MSDSVSLLALDFDGVVCDGLIEYFATTQRAYRQIWGTEADDSLAEAFYRLRPVIETGWEMPILLRALVLGKSETEIINRFSAIALEITQQENLVKQAVVDCLDGVRDRWIEQNLSEWLDLHRFYPGVIERLHQILASGTMLYIVTTKEGRFVKQLLAKQGLELPAEQIVGKESKRPKYETLRILRSRHQKLDGAIQITFIEDRLKALQQVAQQPDLASVRLLLADWGYNLESDRQIAASDRRIDLLSLEHFQKLGC